MDLLMLAEYLRTGQKAAWWGACLLASAAALTRYVGVCMVGAGSLLLLFQPGRETGRRWRDAIVYGVVGILPVAGYVGSNWVTQNSPFGERGFAVAGYDPNFTRAALGVFLNWIIPGRLVNDHEYLALGALLAGILIFAGWVSWNKREAIQTVLRAWWSSPITKFLLGFLLLNGFILFILLFTSGIIGRGESFSNRYLSPLYASLLVLTLGLAGILWKALDGKARLVLSLAGLVLAASFIYRSLETVRDLNQNGAGYASQRWHISETVAFLNKHPDVPVVSTANYGIYFWTGRLPQSISDFPDVAALHNYLRVSHAYLAIIDSMPPEMYKLDTSSLLSGLELVYRFSEGSIYQAVP
jgi:hypothetical protein